MWQYKLPTYSSDQKDPLKVVFSVWLEIFKRIKLNLSRRVCWFFTLCLTSTSDICRYVVTCSFPRGCSLRRLQPHPHRHFPHALHNHRRDERLRSLHQPDRHRSSVGVNSLAQIMCLWTSMVLFLVAFYFICNKSIQDLEFILDLGSLFNPNPIKK